MIAIRNMSPGDIEAVLAIQRASYSPAMNESAEVFRARLLHAPEHAWTVSLDGEIGAYLMGYPSTLGKITPLHGEFAVPHKPDCLYLHDLAVHPAWRGHGLGQLLVDHALAACHWPFSALVCVQDALGFWQNQGFSEFSPLTRGQTENLASYPGKPRYLAKTTV